jgi:hypothetical protein
VPDVPRADRDVVPIPRPARASDGRQPRRAPRPPGQLAAALLEGLTGLAAPSDAAGAPRLAGAAGVWPGLQAAGLAWSDGHALAADQVVDDTLSKRVAPSPVAAERVGPRH